MMARGEESRNLRGRGGGGVAALEGSLIGWATPAAARLRFKTESRGERYAFMSEYISSRQVSVLLRVG